MANFNRVILLGNLTRDIEIRYTQSGTALGKFGMAINRRYGGADGEQRESTCFVDCTAWGKSAEIIQQYTSKGSPLFVEGRLEYSTWEAKDGGGKRSKLEVVVENFQLLGSRGGAEGGGSRAQRRPAQDSGEAAADFDEIPF